MYETSTCNETMYRYYILLPYISEILTNYLKLSSESLIILPNHMFCSHITPILQSQTSTIIFKVSIRPQKLCVHPLHW
eukprot:c46803_g1_i1 orf=3-233(-)